MEKPELAYRFMVEEPILNYWYRALSSPLGIEIICNNPETVRSRLYAARKEARDPDLDAISISVSPFDPLRLWLVKKNSNGDSNAPP